MSPNSRLSLCYYPWPGTRYSLISCRSSILLIACGKKPGSPGDDLQPCTTATSLHQRRGGILARAQVQRLRDARATKDAPKAAVDAANDGWDDVG